MDRFELLWKDMIGKYTGFKLEIQSLENIFWEKSVHHEFSTEKILASLCLEMTVLNCFVFDEIST